MSIAIFDKLKDATDYSDLIHVHLTANRSGYNAVRWSDENKHDNKNEWAVKIPYDLDKLIVKMDEKDLEKSIRKIDKYPDDWDDPGEDQNEQ